MNCAPRLHLAIFLLLAAAAPAFAQPRPASNALEPARGKALLLDNDRILEGEIEKVNDQYRIRRTVGELWINADRAKSLCKDVDEAYEIMKRQINLKDPDERLRLSRWCQMNGLRTHALHEAKVALDMRPDHLETVRMVQMLQRLAVANLTASAPQPQPQAPPVVRHVPRPTVDVSTDSFALFATRVQPILMNTCVSCHSQGKGGGFQLVRVSDGNARASAQANLNAALEYVNSEKAVLSPLLIKAVVAHGGAATAPLKGRQTVPFQTMQAWVDDLLSSNPHIKEMRQAEAPGGATTSAKKEYTNEPFPPAMAEKAPLLRPAPVSPRPLPSDVIRGGDIVSRPTLRPEEAKTAPPPTPRDPFDPIELNSRPR